MSRFNGFSGDSAPNAECAAGRGGTLLWDKILAAFGNWLKRVRIDRSDLPIKGAGFAPRRAFRGAAGFFFADF